mmetsp:Transcript_64545/g.144961  ORF Transcript_64545/g.144961 Transcript_64545/m.144961 type:complete len:212 (+) Transcript_64545:85-720(+)
MPAKPKSKKGGGYNTGDNPPVAPAAVPEPQKKLPDPKKDESGSEPEDGSESESGSDEAPPQAPSEPKFKTLAEKKEYEEALKKAALEDEATIKRLEEVRLRRERARLEREAAANAQAEEAALKKAEVEAAEAARQKALTERPELEMPGPKEVKDACVRLQQCASDDFLQKHGLKGAGGNKLAKIKMADFKKIFDDFQNNAPLADLHKYKGT